MEKDATASAHVVMAGLVIRLLVAVFVHQVSLATSVKTVAHQVSDRRIVFLFDDN